MFRRLVQVVSVTVPALVVLIVIILAAQSMPAIRAFGLGFLVGREWNPVTLSFGALPAIYGTVVSSAIAILIALPVGVGVSLFLVEPTWARVRSTIGLGVEMLAAIPSVVYGLWGLYVMGPFVYRNFEVPVSDHLGFIPLFGDTPRQTSMLAAGLVVAVMILPTLASVSRDVIQAVPTGLRESSVALGATWWETNWKVILPAARAGIFGAAVLALGRALGETIAVTMVIGNRPEISASLFAPSYTLASVIANEFTEATGQLYPAAVIELGLVLVLVTLTVNLGATLMVRRVVRR